MQERNGAHIFAIITVGFPFVAYKIIVGLLLFRYFPDTWLEIPAFLLIALGYSDLFLNGINLITRLHKKKGVSSLCVISFLTESYARRQNYDIEHWENLGLAADMMIAFSFVCTMIGANLFGYLELWQLYLWNGCTVVNILAAGYSRLALAWEDAFLARNGTET